MRGLVPAPLAHLPPPALGRLPPDARAPRPRPFIRFLRPAAVALEARPAGHVDAEGVRSSLLGRGGVVALPAVLRRRESAVLLVRRARGRSAGRRAPRREKTRARDDSEAPPGRGEDAPRRLRAQTGRRRGDGPRAARPRGLRADADARRAGPRRRPGFR